MHWVSRCLMLIFIAGSVGFSVDAQARRVVFKVSDGITVVGEELGT